MEGSSKRLRRSAEQMYDVVAGWPQSGQSRQAYCATHGLSVSVFQYWLRQWRESQEEQQGGEFVEVRPQPSVLQGFIVEYPNGIKVHVPTSCGEDQLRRLFKLI